jgi:hypothetical protein
VALLLLYALLSEAAAPSETGEGAPDQPTPTAHSGGLDASNFIVVLIAVAIISYCAFRAVTPSSQSASVMAGPPQPCSESFRSRAHSESRPNDRSAAVPLAVQCKRRARCNFGRRSRL